MVDPSKGTARSNNSFRHATVLPRPAGEGIKVGLGDRGTLETGSVFTGGWVLIQCRLSICIGNTNVGATKDIDSSKMGPKSSAGFGQAHV